jgi:hypothetical protein
MTKEVYEATILRLQREISDLTNGIMAPGDNRTAEEQIRELESQLDRYVLEYSKLINGEDFSDQPLDYTFTEDPLRPYIKDSLNIIALSADGDEKVIHFDRYEDSGINYAMVSYINKNVMDTRENSGKGTALSMDDAREIAAKMVSNLNIGEFVLVDEYMNRNTINEFVFAKSYNGIPLNIVTPAVSISGGVSDVAPFNIVVGQEQLIVSVNSIGIVRVEWAWQFDETITENKNVALLALDEIKDIFKSQILHHILGNSDDSEKKITIHEIRLGYMIIPIKDNPAKYRTILVWDFIEEAVNEILNRKIYTSYLTINAIDGSIIDRTQGY